MTELLGGSRMHTYERDGLTLGYSVVGGGQPILFVHGATATGEFEWGRLAATLASDYQCVLPDLRGHGRSEFRESDDLGQDICADLRHLIEHLGLDHPHIVGFSYGSEIALMLELSAPGTARSLVLVSPGTGRPSDYRAPRLEHLYRTWPFALRRLHREAPRTGALASAGDRFACGRRRPIRILNGSIGWCRLSRVDGGRRRRRVGTAGPGAAVRRGQRFGAVHRTRRRGARRAPQMPRYVCRGHQCLPD